jgi:hypothetical protein
MGEIGTTHNAINPNLVKDEFSTEGDGGEEEGVLLLARAENDHLPLHVLAECVGAEVEAEEGEGEVEGSTEYGQQLTVGVHHACFGGLFLKGPKLREKTTTCYHQDHIISTGILFSLMTLSRK